MYKENHIVIHNESSYDYDFTMEELSEQLERKTEGQVESMKKYITFSELVKKKLKL